MIAVPSLAALLIEELPPARRALAPLFADLFRDLKDVLVSAAYGSAWRFFFRPSAVPRWAI